MNFNVTYNARTPGPAHSLVTGMLSITATDALHALTKTAQILYEDPEIESAQWEAFNLDVQPED